MNLRLLLPTQNRSVFSVLLVAIVTILLLNQLTTAQKVPDKIKTPPTDEGPASRISFKEFKEESKLPPVPEPSFNFSPTLITSTSYQFFFGNNIALEDMSSGSTLLIGPNTDDNNSATVDIGFDFWYDGGRYTQFGVNGNGFARLGAAPTGNSNVNSLATITNTPKIAPYWDDLCVGRNGKVHYKTIGTAPNRRLVVEWQNMQISRGSGCVGNGNGTFQMRLFESTGIISF